MGRLKPGKHSHHKRTFAAVLATTVTLAVLFYLFPRAIKPNRVCALQPYWELKPRTRTSDVKEAFITLLSDETPHGKEGLSYVDAAVVLLWGLKKVGSSRPTVVLVDRQISQKSRDRLLLFNATLLEIQNIDPPKSRVQYGKWSQRFTYSFSKLWAFQLDHMFSKVVSYATVGVVSDSNSWSTSTQIT